MEEFYAGGMDHGVGAVVPGFGEEARAGGGVDEKNLVLDDDGPMSFYATDFPPLPDFPRMSSSSSSSSTQAPVKGTSSSCSASSTTSSAASWAVLRSDQDVEQSPDPMVQQPVMVPHQMGAAATTPLASALSSTASMDMMILSENVKMDDVRFEEGKEEVGLEDCLDVMETFGYMDLLECNDLFDPASIFQSEEPGADPTIVADNNGAYPVEEFDQVLHQLPVQEQPEQNFQQPEAHAHPASAVQPYEQQQQLPVVKADASDEMGQLLLEWLRTNRDSISAEDLRRIKIKKATIELAAQRLGGGKTAMKQLLKLILQWVQTNHLNRKQKEAEAQTKLSHYSPFQDVPDPGAFPNPNPNVLNPSNTNSFSPEPASCFPGQPQWGSPYMTEHAGSVMAAPPSFVPSNVGYMGGDLFTGSGDLYPGQQGMADYHMLESPHSWSMPHFASASQYNYMTADPNFQQQQTFVGYGNNPQYTNFPQQYYNTGNGERSVTRLGSSATKEARKKRMARQRRQMLHHHHRGGHHANHHASHHNGHHQAVMAMDHQQHARLGGCDQAAAANSGNWVYWPAQAPAIAAPAPPPMLPPDQAMHVHPPVERQPAAAATQGQSGQRGQVAPDRRQGWKSENNLKFLLQKVLKQSDVGNLGRIVLPKKEAETHLPELEARDGISISMEDIGTCRVWNMRYRFWPNNKSRMYLLENTGDFVRANGLQEGDFIVIYSDVKCGKYLIRGVKVRQTEGGSVKSDPKRPENSKPQRNSSLQGSTTTGAGHATQSK